MADSERISQYYRKKLEQHELTPEEWVAVRYAVIKHTLIAAATTVTLGTSAFFYARSRSWGRMQSLAFASAGNLVGLSVGGVIAMESGMKTVENRLQGSGSELLYLMDRYSKATLKERSGEKDNSGLSSYESTTSENTVVAPRMIRVQDSTDKSE
ncbi:hypothetical protein BGX29_008956 [Mortierella sp. GBA35]|nr:hypothetical protein BGX29_008956 [Mortierella sp. GBA35]KAF9098082.1 hypothetical protein BGX23_007074 [Mortierella sp. AD031]KAG0209602.1 hypothetical protein BGX33_005448 [Mortierella sp. NVP41]